MVESPCFPCLNVCAPTVECPNCNPVPCNNCSEAYSSECVFTNQVLKCTTGTFQIEAGLSLDEVFKQLICKINELETKITFIMTTCCDGAVVCDVPGFLSVTE